MDIGLFLWVEGKFILLQSIAEIFVGDCGNKKLS